MKFGVGKEGRGMYKASKRRPGKKRRDYVILKEKNYWAKPSLS